MRSKQTSSGENRLNVVHARWSSIFLRTTGMSLWMFAALAAFLLVGSPALAQTETVLYSFSNDGIDGNSPFSSLTLDAQGNLYGTADFGGTSDGSGTVFKISPTGTETVLYNFSGGADGANPDSSRVVSDKAGNLYGTTNAGGDNSVGTVFKLTPSGIETVLHSFAADGVDGFNPDGGLVIDGLGNLYGTTIKGGASNFGTVFKVTPAGLETVLHSFAADGTEGCNPRGGVVRGKRSSLYGTTSGCGAQGAGTVFQLTLTKARTLTVLHTFNADGTDGTFPDAGVVFDKVGNLYGTTSQGGASDSGTVFKITPAGAETVLHAFATDGTDGLFPNGVILDKLGNLYGTTSAGGTGKCGTVFKVAPDGTETVLHPFCSNAQDGANPQASLVLGKKNTLYGTTENGGSFFSGTVFKLVP
jgi:uncharacterized repeat protein (TIGR03803 family)